MGDFRTIPERWGTEYFQCVPAYVLAPLPLRPEDAQVLREVGLPGGPKEALTLYMRWENVEIIHQPSEVRLVTDAGLERGRHFPKTGWEEIDAWGDLSKFVVLGEVPNDRGAGAFNNRFICVDGVKGNVWWLYPNLFEGKSVWSLFNSSLPGYLECLLAYKEFREDWFRLLAEYPDEDTALDDARYQSEADGIHSAFLSRLEQADPEGFHEGFWEFHAWNERILMAV